MGGEGRELAAILQRSGVSPALPSPLSRVLQARYTALIRTLTGATRDEARDPWLRPVKKGAFVQACRRLLRDVLLQGFHAYHLALEDLVPRLRTDGDEALPSCAMSSAFSCSLP